MQIEPVCTGCFYLAGPATEGKAADSLFTDLKYGYRRALDPTGKVVLCLRLGKVERLEKGKIIGLVTASDSNQWPKKEK